MYHLNYYSDETCKRLRGSIDLEQCAEIVESLDSNVFPHLLAIKTSFKAKQRTYFLATDTEEEMTKWVRNLCSVCGMKADDPGFAPPVQVRQSANPHASQQQPSTGEMVKPQHVPNNQYVDSPQAASLVTKPGANVQPTVDPILAYTELGDFIPLESGISVRMKPDRPISVDSCPEELAPLPPVMDNVFDGVSADDQTSTVPPTGRLDDEHLYKVLPVLVPEGFCHSHFDSGTYDVPPRRTSPSTTCSSRSSSQKYTESGHSSLNAYDYPPVRNDVGVHRDDYYDVPPGHVVPPSRPPKLELYMNLSENRKHLDLNTVAMGSMCLPPEGPKDEFNELYSFPRSTAVTDMSDKLLAFTPPPPPVMCSPQKCEYINAKQPEFADGYMTMNSFVASIAKARDSSSTDNGTEYTDMSGNACDPPRDCNSLYDYPPLSCPVNSPDRSTRSSDKHDSCALFSTSRTRSFKKKYVGDSLKIHIKTSGIQILANTSVSLPQRAERNLHVSDSDEDEEVWETSPPVPTNKVFELKYIDLDHNEVMDKEPVRSSITPCPCALTEYHDIDFKKTDALRRVKETVSVERSKEKNSNL